MRGGGGASGVARRRLGSDARDARMGDDMKFVNSIKTFVRDDEGQDLIEYALLVALISLVCVVALTDAGTEVNKIFVSIKDKLASAGAGS
jgi:pilus assembly protein Flp/PilA